MTSVSSGSGVFYYIGGAMDEYKFNSTSIRRPFTETGEQIIIQRSRNLTISDTTDVRRKIELGNYYNIFNGYKDVFLDLHMGEEKYLQGTSFEEVYSLFSLDSELRSLFMKEILGLENSLKSYSARVFSEKYGPYGYLLSRNYDCADDKKLCDVHNLLTRIQGVISKQLSYKDQMIFHYISNDGHVPIWVLMNKMTMGELSKFYSCLHDREKDAIGKFFGVMRKDLELYLNNLTYFRNVCAHDERFYNFRTKKPITNTEIHDKLNLPRNCSGNFEKGKTDLFSLLIIIKRLSETASFEVFVEKLNDAIQTFLMNLKTVTKEYFLAQMGFPGNWKEIEKI